MDVPSHARRVDVSHVGASCWLPSLSTQPIGVSRRPSVVVMQAIEDWERHDTSVSLGHSRHRLFPARGPGGGRASLSKLAYSATRRRRWTSPSTRTWSSNSRRRVVVCQNSFQDWTMSQRRRVRRPLRASRRSPGLKCHQPSTDALLMRFWALVLLAMLVLLVLLAMKSLSC